MIRFTDRRLLAMAPALVLSFLCAHCSSEAGPPVATSPTPPATTASVPPEPPAVCPAGSPIEIVAGKVVAQVAVGDARIRAVFDTGAPQSLIASTVPGAASGKPLEIEMAGRKLVVPKVRLGDERIKTLRMPGVAAVIGLDAVEALGVTIDYVRHKLVLSEAVDERALDACDHVEAGAAWVPTTRRDHVFVRGTVDSLEGWLLVDSGASLGVLTKSAFTTLEARAPRPSVGGFYTPAALGTFWARVTIVDAMVVGSSRVEHMLARTIDDELLDGAVPEDAPFLGVVPSDFFKSAMVTYDLAGKRIRFSRARSASPALPSRLFPTGIELEEKLEPPVRVGGVLAGSAAADAGIAAGDEIVSIDGARADTMDPYWRPFALAPDQPGVRVRVITKRDGTERTNELEGRDLL